MEATCSSETSVDFQRTARRYIPEANTPNISVVIAGAPQYTVKLDFVVNVNHLFLSTVDA
jgi:hypothetical protein